MMRLRRASAIVVLSLLTSATTASADWAWILWSQGVRDKTPITWCLTCLPDTVDPRRAEAKTNDAP